MDKRTIVDTSLAPAVYSKPESHPYIERMKKSALTKINSKPRYLAVCRQRDLGICLLALDRPADAIDVLRFAQHDVTIRSGVEVWDAASHAAALIAYICRRDPKYSPGKDLQKFIDEPANALFTQSKIWTTAQVNKHLATERARHSLQFTNPKIDARIEAMCWWASALVYYRMFAELGYPSDKTLDLKQLDNWIEEILIQIRDTLAAQANSEPGKCR